MTYSTQERSSTQTRPWTSLRLLSYAYSCSTRTTPNTRARLRKRDATPSRRSNTLPLDWLAASGIASTIEGPIAWTSNMTARPDVQDDFLQTLVNDKTAVNVFLVNGIRLSGQLASFDQFVVLLEYGSGSQIVFKLAISTVLPVNGRGPARDRIEAPMSRDKPNHLQTRVR